MSTVINQAKIFHKKALSIEIVIFLISFLFSFLWVNLSSSISLFLGEVAGLLPHFLFFLWFFSKKSQKNKNKMVVLFCGEGIKWGSTIILIVLFFKFFINMNIVAFFVGYFFILLLNSLLPIYLKIRAK
ncbi:ATP synthase subunit I [Otariodibacter sp.]|uniref:ATP synthase subunit I n=1 Tax=Otariodibacter sp. TaxID=3030919 RepID=UPI00260E7F28|nr:ATP synthase subunit I [Otariodibacter sp.]